MVEGLPIKKLFKLDKGARKKPFEFSVTSLS